MNDAVNSEDNVGLWGRMRRLYIRTSVALQRSAQRAVLDHFCAASIDHRQEALPSGGYLNYVEIQNKTKAKSENKSTLVLMHGFGSGLGFFFANYDALSEQFDRIIAVDWMGMGASSRDHISPRLTNCGLSNFGLGKKHGQMTPSKAADFFIDNLEEFRLKKELDTFVLAGHSLGGFLVGKYALKYPKAVKSLVLISPVGLPAAPTEAQRMKPHEMSWFMRGVHTAWSSNFTPQSLVRYAGPKGEDMVEGVLNRRFSKRWEGAELKLISSYFYHLSAAPACGEYAMNSLLFPVMARPSPGSNRMRGGVYAREPLDLNLRALKVPLLVMFGDTDWLYYPEVADSLAAWKSAGVDAKVSIIPNAGHHLYLDNPSTFHSLMKDWKLKVYK